LLLASELEELENAVGIVTLDPEEAVVTAEDAAMAEAKAEVDADATEVDVEVEAEGRSDALVVLVS
jgi:ethanolamine utilization microcompartment shell protein EutS